MIPMLVAATASATMNYLGQKSAQDELRKKSEADASKWDEMQKVYERNLIHNDEMTRRADSIGDTFDTAGMSTINASGVSSRNILNPATVQALTLSRIAGAKAQAMTQEQGRLMDMNREMSLKAGEAGANAGSIRKMGAASNFDFGSFAGSILGGAQAGMQIEDFMSSQALLDKKLKGDAVKTVTDVVKPAANTASNLAPVIEQINPNYGRGYRAQPSAATKETPAMEFSNPLMPQFDGMLTRRVTPEINPTFSYKPVEKTVEDYLSPGTLKILPPSAAEPFKKRQFKARSIPAWWGEGNI